MTNAPIIRRLKTPDINAVAEQMMSLNQIHFQACPEIFRVLTFINAVDYLNQKIDQEMIFVAEIAEQIVGYMHFEVNEREATIFSHPRKCIFLHQLYVKDEFRRQGIGALLISTMKSFAQDIEDLKWIWFEVCDFNAAAIRFYQQQGFEKMGHRMSIGKASGFR